MINKLFRLDYSSILLISSNILTIILAITQNWSLGILLWIYWFQSIIIGILNVFKILVLKNFSTENFKINEQNVSPNNRTKIFVALFFAFHYGFFHFIYSIFLTLILTVSLIDSKIILLTALIFLINHSFSFFSNLKNDRNKNIGQVMFFPYIRIIPMHLIILLGFFIGNSLFGLILFLLLKTLADLITHNIEHY